MDVSPPADLLVSSYFTARNSQSWRPLITITEAEKTILFPEVLSREDYDPTNREALLAAARDMREGVLSAWSYAELTAETAGDRSASLHRGRRGTFRSWSHGGLDVGSGLFQRRTSPRLRERSLAKEPRTPSHRTLPPSKKHRGRPKLDLSPETSAEVGVRA